MEVRRVIAGGLRSIGIHGLSNKGINAPKRLSLTLGDPSGGYFILYTLYFVDLVAIRHLATQPCSLGEKTRPCSDHSITSTSSTSSRYPRRE